MTAPSPPKKPQAPITYKDAGVDTNAKTLTLARLKPLFQSTFTPAVATPVGAFGGAFSLPLADYRQPLLVSSVDGVGTKLKVASLMNKHDTVGCDLVNHCVNDILAQGARPLFFLDYFAAGKLDPNILEQVVRGLVAACRDVGCALLGGETAEMPGLYQPGEYDLVGFITGLVEADRLVTGANISPGDAVIGLASNGLHTNGYSLARKLFFEIAALPPDHFIPELERTIGDELLRIHRCYAPSVLTLLDEFPVKGMAHITGGGLPDNLLRCLPEGCLARIHRGSWHVPKIFRIIQKLGQVPPEDMFHTFNMGVGFVLILAPEHAPPAASRLRELGDTPFPIGQIEAGPTSVLLD
jgi:phosphoribosylformylglycinamidine cyclo-ligase